jgi:hypothetical protein
VSSAPNPNATAFGRAVQGLRKFIREEDPLRTFQGVWEYQVTSATASAFTGQPTDALNAPQLPQNVPFRLGVAGVTHIPAVGSLVLVSFINQDPGRPFVMSFDGNTPTTWTADTTGSMTLGAHATGVSAGTAYGFALRSGDVVSHNGFTGPIVFVSAGAAGVTPIAGQSNVKV